MKVDRNLSIDVMILLIKSVMTHRYFINNLFKGNTKRNAS